MNMGNENFVVVVVQHNIITKNFQKEKVVKKKKNFVLIVENH